MSTMSGAGASGGSGSSSSSGRRVPSPNPSGGTTTTRTTSSPSITVQETLESEQQPQSTGSSTLILKLKKPKQERKVDFSAGTVDNEHMNKKKSKCCCVYKKPHVFGESSSDTDDECEHCTGHSEKKKKTKKGQNLGDESGAAGPSGSGHPELGEPVPA